jgi:hypothetical protein
MKKETKTSWKWVATVFGTPLAAIVFMYALFNHEADHLRQIIPLQIKDAITEALKPVNGEVASVSSQLAEIKGELVVLRPQIQEMLLSKFKKISSQPKQEFDKQLPELQQTVRAARLLKVHPDTALLKTVSLKLSEVTDKNASYWPVTADFLNFRSEASSPTLAERVKANRDSLPRCTEKPPTAPIVNKVLDLHHVEIKMAQYQKCRVALDDPEDAARLNKFIKDTAFIEFEDSLIEYHGGEIQILLHRDKNDPKRRISTLRFTKCIFDFSTAGEPSPLAQWVLQSLLLNLKGEIVLQPGAKLFY